MTRVLLQYIEALVGKALDHAALCATTDVSERNVLAVLAHHNEYQASRSATLVNKYNRIRAMTTFESAHVPVEGYQDGASTLTLNAAGSSH